MTVGARAFSLVKAYAGIGNHRTGTSGDRDTLRWLQSALSALGADACLQGFFYDHFDAELALHCAGKNIEAEALCYSFDGSRQLRDPATGVVDAHADEATVRYEIDAKVARAKAAGRDGLILATQCPTGDLWAINRAHGPALDFPVVLVPERDLKISLSMRLSVWFTVDLLLASDAASWIGEFMCWAPKYRPMLSIAEQAPHFHPPGDSPEAVTTPELLMNTIKPICAAALALAKGNPER